MNDEAANAVAAAHSAEHILSAVMQRDFGTGRSLETHLGVKKSKCDYRVPRALAQAEIRGIDDAVNAEIARDLLVTSFVVSRADAEGRYDLGKVPTDADTIRVVRIGDLDAVPCIGEHVERTSQIGRFEIASAEMRGDDRIRIRFRLRETAEGEG
jgi:misacylated tRNA(Ala) deacylase